MVEMGEAFASRPDLGQVVTQLVQRLPELLGLHFAGLYLVRRDRLQQVAGPEELPPDLPQLDALIEHLRRRGTLVRLDDLAPMRLLSEPVDRLADELERRGVDAIGLLATRRRTVGLVLLSEKTGQTALEREEVELLEGLFRQASIALETSVLLDERAAQAELEQELKIAAAIQSTLLPERLDGSHGWEVVATCRPAREVGGDFYTELPCLQRDGRAVAYGDVSGKSISGALMMMAAHEVLNALALTHPDPEELLRLANERLYRLRGRGTGSSGGSFVALGWIGLAPDSGHVRYALAGQPPPLVVRTDGRIDALALPPHRLPLGAPADPKPNLVVIAFQSTLSIIH